MPNLPKKGHTYTINLNSLLTKNSAAYIPLSKPIYSTIIQRYYNNKFTKHLGADKTLS